MCVHISNVQELGEKQGCEPGETGTVHLQI